MARPPALWALVTVLAIYGGLKGATAVTTATDSSPSSTADFLSTTADPLLTTADPLSTTDDPLSTTDDSLSITADSSSSTNDSLLITAEISSSTDGSPSSTADSSLSTADSPSSTADSPSSTADSPSSTADSASSTAESSSSTADSPSSTPDSPSSTAGSPSSTADSASSTAKSSSSTADSPSSTPDPPSSTAESSSSTADSPLSTADSPLSTADSLSTTVNSLSSTVDNNLSTADPPSSTGEFPPFATDSSTSTIGPFIPFTTHSLSSEAYPDASAGSSIFPNGTNITTERKRRDSPEENQPKIEKMMETGDDKIEVSWTDLNCTEGYEMKGTCTRNYTCCSDPCMFPSQMDLNGLSTTFLVEPCTTYTVKVRGQYYCNSTWSDEKSYSTECTEPTKPRNLMVTKPAFNTSDSTSRMAYITWDSPFPTNGHLNHYLLDYVINNEHHELPQINIPDNCEDKNKYDGHHCSYSLELQPESDYKFSVRAVNEESLDIPSPEASFSLTTEAGKPFFTRKTPLSFEKDKVKHNSITLLIDGSSFSNANGKIRKCLVKMKKGCDGKTIQNQSVYCTDKPPNTEFEVVIEEENPTPSDCPNYELISYLEPEECYTFWVYIFTKRHSNISGFIEITTKEHPLVPVLYGVLGVFMFLLVGVVAAYGVFRYRYRPLRQSESIDLPLVVPSPPDVSVERRILLSDLLATVQKLFSNGSDGLTTEYAQIQALSTSKPCRNAQLPVNRVKTRYLNILPFDETRVVLKEYTNSIGSDYINASYIHGYSVAREFIACQGPLANTVGDFWRMVWEKNVHVIVMVTQCFERNREKCSKYWPDSGKSFSFGDFTLKVRHLQEQEHQEDGFIQRTLQLSKIRKVRTIHHFHFVSWPDMGCPDTPDKLINFVKVVKDTVPKESAHVVVHCSAGVGRTGTFIGLSNLIEEMHEQDSIDVFHTVYRMRLYRTNMVQTKVQYAFLYKCVLKYYLDQRGESESWSAIEKRLDNPEAIPDVINGALQGPQHDQSDEGDISGGTSKENVSQKEKGSQLGDDSIRCAEIIQLTDEQ